MEADASLVGTNGVAELHTVTEVDMHLAMVVHPRYTEGDDTVGFHQPLYQLHPLKLRMPVINTLYGKQYFPYSLQVLGLAGMLGLQLLENQLCFHLFLR